jgi:hypothetical protein
MSITVITTLAVQFDSDSWVIVRSGCGVQGLFGAEISQ